jgi:hypothetical protein
MHRERRLRLSSVSGTHRRSTHHGAVALTAQTEVRAQRRHGGWARLRRSYPDWSLGMHIASRNIASRNIASTNIARKQREDQRRHRHSVHDTRQHEHVEQSVICRRAVLRPAFRTRRHAPGALNSKTPCTCTPAHLHTSEKGAGREVTFCLV